MAPHCSRRCTGGRRSPTPDRRASAPEKATAIESDVEASTRACSSITSTPSACTHRGQDVGSGTAQFEASRRARGLDVRPGASRQVVTNSVERATARDHLTTPQRRERVERIVGGARQPAESSPPVARSSTLTSRTAQHPSPSVSTISTLPRAPSPTKSSSGRRSPTCRPTPPRRTRRRSCRAHRRAPPRRRGDTEQLVAERSTDVAVTTTLSGTTKGQPAGISAGSGAQSPERRPARTAGSCSAGRDRPVGRVLGRHRQIGPVDDPAEHRLRSGADVDRRLVTTAARRDQYSSAHTPTAAQSRPSSRHDGECRSRRRRCGRAGARPQQVRLAEDRIRTASASRGGPHPGQLPAGQSVSFMVVVVGVVPRLSAPGPRTQRRRQRPIRHRLQLPSTSRPLRSHHCSPH